MTTFNCTIGKTDWAFEIATHPEGAQIIIGRWNDGTECDSVFTADTLRLPQTEEEAVDFLESFGWDAVMGAVIMTANLKALRESAGLTQKELGALLGYVGDAAQKSVSNWETNFRPVPRKHLVELAKILSIDVKELL